jgi:hypothetical protein
MAIRHPKGRISRENAVKKLAKAIGISENAMQQRIRYAVQRGHLQFESRDPDAFIDTELASWAVNKSRISAAAVTSALGIPIVRQLRARISACSKLRGCLSHAPGTLASCQAVIFEQATRIAELESELAAARAQLDEWRPTIEAKQRERDLKRKKSLGRGRPRKKQ